ncbi:hypothetical protein EB796_015200 [Bugula neritina]|uniref:Uncharacterized protein n=1 Tax=Bugula neritina TaxID=10212 RepID=A0A7J7JM83_BUGNE|nr:hypothetical protein EB796_015200 [Bugula neritina]
MVADEPDLQVSEEPGQTVAEEPDQPASEEPDKPATVEQPTRRFLRNKKMLNNLQLMTLKQKSKTLLTLSLLKKSLS